MKFKCVAKVNIGLLPRTPGVYAFLKEKEVLYIGKAINLQDRVKNHFAQPTFKDGLFVNETTKIGYLETQSEIDALLLESGLIKKIQPKYNVMWRDDKNYFFVAITKEKLPRIFLTHQLQTKNYQLKTDYIGPFVDGKAIKTALRALRKPFPYYVKKHGVKPCPWCHLHLCPGPNPNPKEYKKNLAKLIAVLKGKRKNVLKNIEKEMKRAAESQNFEQALQLRNQLFALERIASHTKNEEYEHGKNIAQELQQIFKSKNPINKIEAYDISNMQGKEATGSCVVFINGKPAKQWYRKFKMRISGTPNDFAMMEETISRRLNHPEWPYPDLMIIDGGKGQLTAALKALRKSEIRSTKSETNTKYKILNTKYKIQVAAIAKKHNELFLPGKKEPLLLKNLPQSVENLILHIRDEAHRFAITYHKQLRRVDFFTAG